MSATIIPFPGGRSRSLLVSERDPFVEAYRVLRRYERAGLPVPPTPQLLREGRAAATPRTHTALPTDPFEIVYQRIRADRRAGKPVRAVEAYMADALAELEQREL